MYVFLKLPWNLGIMVTIKLYNAVKNLNFTGRSQNVLSCWRVCGKSWRKALTTSNYFCMQLTGEQTTNRVFSTPQQVTSITSRSGRLVRKSQKLNTFA